MDDSTPHAVYRHFSQSGCLLYVGCSKDPVRRWDTLQVKERWTYLSARRVDQWMPTRTEARLAERIAIKTEHPVFNLQGVRGIRRRRGHPHRRTIKLTGRKVLHCWFEAEFGWLIGDQAIAEYQQEVLRRDLAMRSRLAYIARIGA